jgi:ribonuclease T1
VAFDGGSCGLSSTCRFAGTLITALTAGVLLASFSAVQARDAGHARHEPNSGSISSSVVGGASDSASDAVRQADLPREAQATSRLIRSQGPFPYANDGVVFGNRERILPRHPRGFYREYTVKTPGSRDRGARRIVCGGLQPAAPETCYYTSDHYTSFKRIVQ